MKLVNRAYVDLDGAEIRQPPRPGIPATGDDPVVTVAVSLVNACLSPSANGAPYSAEKAAARYMLAVNLYAAKQDDEIDVPSDLIAELKNDVLRLYTPIIAGQFVAMLDPK